MSEFFSVSRRVIEMISAIASSTTLRVFENGALKTLTPCSDAASKSIWFVPMQNAPIATRLSAASSTRAVTLVFDRMPSSDTPAISAISSSSDRARVSDRTVNPALVSSSSASGWICSSSRTCTGVSGTAGPQLVRRFHPDPTGDGQWIRFVEIGAKPENQPSSAPLDSRIRPILHGVATRWLSLDEQRAWRGLLESTRLLFDALDRQLTVTSSMPVGYYEILVNLSEAPDHSSRMGELAELTRSSRSRLSHAVDRLEERGWVERGECPTDRRGQTARLTDAGFAALAAAAPGHVDAVRTHVIDRLTPEQVRQLEEITAAIIAGLEPCKQIADSADSAESDELSAASTRSA
jgi:DNA-binding MarR family transcriptional regulator